MVTILNFLGRHATSAMALGVFLGLVLQPLAAVTKPFLMPAVWALLVLSMMRLERAAFVTVLQKPVRLGTVTLWMLVVSPVLMWLLVSMFPIHGGVVAAMVMTAASSPLMSTPTMGLILGLDGALILTVLVVATFLIPLTLPITALVLVGLDMETGALDLMWRLGALVGSAAVAAALLRLGVGRRCIEEARVSIDGAAVILLWLFAIPLMDGITARLFAEPARMLFLTALSFAVYIGLMLSGAVIFGLLWRDKRAALSVGLASGCRNLAVIIAVLPAGVDPEIMTYFALAQFPIYIMPSLMKPLLGRFLHPLSDRPISNLGGPT
jgi:bile acid:Na+ symporter, BASS family